MSTCELCGEPMPAGEEMFKFHGYSCECPKPRLKPVKFRKKPVVIEAFKWTGGPDQTEDPEWIVEALKDGRASFGTNNRGRTALCINTLEGVMAADVGDWIIKGVKGEIYPCKPDIFEVTYEPAE